MGGGKRITSGATAVPPVAAPLQHMYFLEGGLLVVGNLLKTDVWIHDEVRTHCSVCVQQFLPFRRRHHCRTCGEVVCGGCSSKREICLTDVNVQCATRVCTFCMIRATDASIKLNECAVRETLAMDKRRLSVQPLQLAAGHTTPRAPGTPQSDTFSPAQRFGAHAMTYEPSGYATYAMQQQSDAFESHEHNEQRTNNLRQKQHSVYSIDSELTTGSVVQLWPQPIPDDESARLRIVRHSQMRQTANDPTMNLLVSIIARTLECPVAFIGLVDDSVVWFKASVGWDKTHIARDDCVCATALAQSSTVIVADTNADKRFHANNIRLSSNGGGGSAKTKPMRYYAAAPIRVRDQCIGVVCALDSAPHRDTTSAMASTLEAVANIVSEVLEQRVDGGSASTDRMTTSSQLTTASSSPTRQPPPQQQQQLNELLSDSSSECDSSSTGTDCGTGTGTGASTGLLDLNASLKGLNLSDYAPSQTISNDNVRERTATAPPRTSPRPNPSLYVAAASVPPEYNDKISVSMDLFQRLQSTLWRITPTRDSSVRAFELELVRGRGRSFTRSNTKLSGACADVVALVENYDHAQLYAPVFAHVVRRYKLSPQTWMDELTFQPNTVHASREPLRVLTHARQYPDGSTVVVAMNASKLYDADERDLLFGWFVTPCRLHDGLGAVNVSCIVAQQAEHPNHIQNQIQQLAIDRLAASSSAALTNVSCELMLRLRACLSQGQQQMHARAASSSAVKTAHARSKASRSPHRSTYDHNYSSSSNNSSSSSLSSNNNNNTQQSFYDMAAEASVLSPPPAPQMPSKLPLPLTYRRIGSDATGAFDTNPLSSFDALPSAAASATANAARFSIARTISEESFTSFSSGSSTTASDRAACAKIVPLHRRQQQVQQTLAATSQRHVASASSTTSNLNDNERMMLDLLDKTISTQEILAAQQHEMANVIGYHGSQLERISTAIERVETLLADSGERLKRMPQHKERR